MKKALYFGIGCWCYFFAVSAQTAEEVISHYHQMLGPKDSLRAIHSVHAEIAMSSQGMGVGVTLKIAKEKGVFLSQRMPGGAEQLLIMNTEENWIKGPADLEPKKVPLDEKKEDFSSAIQSQFDYFLPFFSLLNYEEDTGFVVSLKKKPKKINKIKCYIVEFEEKVSPEGDGYATKISYYFSVKDYLLQRIKLQHRETAMVQDFTDYRDVDGILIPHKCIVQHIAMGGHQQSPNLVIKVSAIRINPKFSEDLFTIEEGEYVDE